MKVEDWNNRFPNFLPEEVLSPAAMKRYEAHGIIGIDLNALDILQEFRIKLGVPFRVNHRGLNLRGYRTPKEHLGLGHGSSMSPHSRGCAFDVTPDNMPLHVFKSLAVDFEKWKGIGLYDTFVHLDTWDRFGDGRITQWRKS